MCGWVGDFPLFVTLNGTNNHIARDNKFERRRNGKVETKRALTPIIEYRQRKLERTTASEKKCTSEGKEKVRLENQTLKIDILGGAHGIDGGGFYF